MNINQVEQDEDSVETGDVGLTKYKIGLKNMGSVYAKGLYDIDGILMVDSNGQLMNLYTTQMKDAFNCKQIRCGHCLIPGYRYFFRTQSQLTRFLDERQTGSIYPNTVYCVYYDLDIDFDIPRVKHDMVRFYR